MQFRRLLPDPPQDVEIGALLDDLDLGAHPHRPYTIVNFISSVDGRATLGGRSGGLGDEGDRAVFHGLREQVDVVLAGTGTLAVEHYGRLLRKPERRERRSARGRSPEPLACMITRTGNVPPGVPLLDEPEARVLIFTGDELELPDARAQVEIEQLSREEFTLTTIMRRLREGHGAATMLCEGGPTLFSGLLQEELVDELFLTVAPLLAGGGTGPAITTGPELIEPGRLELRWLLERDGSLFLRYAFADTT